MHVRQRLPYIIRDDSIQGLKISLTNDGLILDQWKIKVSYSLIMFIEYFILISQLGIAALSSVL